MSENTSDKENVILIYTLEDATNKKLFDLIRSLGIECQFEEDFSQLDNHIEQYHPGLIFNPRCDKPIPQICIDKDIDFCISNQSVYKRLSHFIMHISDEGWRTILRDTCFDTIYLFLWYVCDAQVINDILTRCSLRAAQMLMQDLEKHYANIPHSQASNELMQEAEQTTHDFLTLGFELLLQEQEHE